MSEPEKQHRPIQTRFQDRVQRAVTTRRVFPFLAGTTALLAFLAGALMRIVDPDEFKTYWDGVWWAIVTLATVGYGDFVPKNGPGKIVGSMVILFGITFLAFLTATITSMFVSSDQRADSERAAAEAEDYARRNAAALERIEQRLEAIEQRLPGDPGDGDSV